MESHGGIDGGNGVGVVVDRRVGGVVMVERRWDRGNGDDNSMVVVAMVEIADSGGGGDDNEL